MIEDNARKKLLKECAVDLFFEYGFNAVSIKDICNMAGINRAMVSYYYRSKIGLFREIVDDSQKKLENAFLFHARTMELSFEEMADKAVEIVLCFQKQLLICSREISVIRRFLYPAYRGAKVYAPVIRYFRDYLDHHYRSIFNGEEARKQLFLKFLTRTLFFFVLNGSSEEKDTEWKLKNEIMLLKQYFLPEHSCMAENLHGA